MAKFASSRLLPVAFASVVLFSGACGSSDPGTTDPTAEPAASPDTPTSQTDAGTDDAPSNQAVLKIGLNESLSGDFAAVGLPPATGVRMAVEEINDQGGFTVGDTEYTIELVEVDNRSEPGPAVAGTLSIVEDEGIDILFGPTLSALAIQASEITIENDVLHLSAATSWQGEGMLSDPEMPLLFSTQNPVDAVQTMIGEGMKMLGATRVGVLGVDDETTEAASPVATMTAMGLDVVEVRFPPGETDYSSYLTRLKNENIDALFHFTPQAAAQDVLALADELEVATMGYGAHNVAPSVGEGLSLPFVTVTGFPSIDYPATDDQTDFAARVTAFEPNLDATKNLVFYTYDFVYMVVEAMKTAGTVDDTSAIAAALHDLPYEGVVGDICFGDDDRIARYDQAYLFVRDGAVESELFPSSC